MSRIFVSRDRTKWRELNIGVGEDPYHQLDNEGLKVFNPDGSWLSPHITILHAKWQLRDGHEATFSAHTPFLIYPSPDKRFLVVVFRGQRGFEPAEHAPPHNALVLNGDGSVRLHVHQPERYTGQATEFLDAWWYEREVPQFQPPWWAIWRKPIPPKKEIRLKMLIGWVGDSNCTFEALEFDPDTATFGDLVDSGRL